MSSIHPCAVDSARTPETNPRQYGRLPRVAEMLDCGPTFIHGLVKQGKLTPIRLSPRMTVYDLAEVQQLLDSAKEGQS